MIEHEGEARQITRLLEGKTVKIVRRWRTTEVVIQFTEGTALLVDHQPDGLEFSVTRGRTDAIPSE